MVAGSCSRVSLYRRHKRLVAAINALLDNGLISKKGSEEFKRKIETAYAQWRAEWRAKQPKSLRPRGRPMPADDRRRYTVCKKPGCGKPPAPGQAYCSRGCAPLAHYGSSPQRKSRLFVCSRGDEGERSRDQRSRHEQKAPAPMQELPQLVFGFLTEQR